MWKNTKRKAFINFFVIYQCLKYLKQYLKKLNIIRFSSSNVTCGIVEYVFWGNTCMFSLNLFWCNFYSKNICKFHHFLRFKRAVWMLKKIYITVFSGRLRRNLYCFNWFILSIEYHHLWSWVCINSLSDTKINNWVQKDPLRLKWFYYV